ncbi:unnamed protein product [Kuraishia capsulata CBS 1993]|uniref:Bromo domain-containing protein n=1 Tax=Kuraishia capsulata CBS 1993 TaxID=1382522 RepID=W6MJZ6_9ASCO|nr:uncharacterized protein KUCA_T00000849001 [Kuraishia capsulata CBS 1993]CDK24882.1 unnamed protein product [Kuraishia capsulata CBS 1993]
MSGQQSKTAAAQAAAAAYAKVTMLQKIVTLQHIHSLFLASNSGAVGTKPDYVSFNILHLQALINNNPLINPEFDLLNISTSHSITKSKKPAGAKPTLSPVQIVQVIADCLSLDPIMPEDPVISQVPKTTIFKLSTRIQIAMVKDRLIKILNSYKNSALHEISSLEKVFKKRKDEMEMIEQGKVNDDLLIKEFNKTQPNTTDKFENKEKAEAKIDSEPIEEITVKDEVAKTSEKKNIQEEEEKEETTQDTADRAGEEDKSASAVEEAPSASPMDVDEKESEPEEDHEDESNRGIKRSRDDNEQSEVSKRRHRSETPTAPPTNKKFQTIATQLITQISSNRFASMFLQPVSESDEPEYYVLIKNPQDLKKIQKDVKRGEINTFQELEYRLQVMFTNAVMYNKFHSETYNWTIEMMEETANLIKLFKDSL